MRRMNIIEDLGGPTVVAQLLGIKPPSVSGWGGRIPGGRCVELERVTGGRVTVDKMRNDINWIRVPDAAWPHPDGRPCIDLAAAPHPETSTARG